MPGSVKLNNNGVVVPHRKPNLPQLTIQSVNPQSQNLVRIYELIAGGNPRILIRRGEGIGDVLMTTPITRYMKQQFPGCHLTFATNTGYLNGALSAVLENPYVDKIVDWGKYSDSDYDCVLNLHCPCVLHEKAGAPPVSRQDLFARHIGIPFLQNPKPILNLTKEEIKWARDYKYQKIRARKGDKVILVNPFASTEYRSFPLQEIKKACSLLIGHKNFKVVVLTHNDSDFSRGESWHQYCHHIARDIPARLFGALGTQSDLLLCPDSAGLHIAGALDIPALGIFGPTDPRARVNHYKTVVALWPSYDLGCYCWYESHKCQRQTCWYRVKAKDIHDHAVGIMSGDIENNYYEERNGADHIQGELI